MPSLIDPAFRQKKRNQFRDINVTPMVDVMLVLLVIFMVTAPMMQSEIEVELPDDNVEASSELGEPPIELTVNSNGNMSIGEDLVERNDLKSVLDQMMQRRSDRTIYLRADGKNTYEQVFQVMGLLKSIGYEKINLVGATRGQ